MASDKYPKVAEYFVVAGLTDTSQPLDEDVSFSSTNLKLGDHRKDPITDICIIDRTLEESCPQEFTCIEETPSGFPADLNHGSLTAHNMCLCYRRGRDKPPLVDLGVYYESLETVRGGIEVIETTPAGKSANVNNKSGMGSHPIYITYRRAKDSAPQNTLVVTDICIILTNKGERAPYAFCHIEKNLNKGLIGSNVYLCYKKSMRQVDSISYKAGFIDRFPRDDVGSFPLPATVPLFCLPMGATIECWSSKTKHPLPTFSSFVLTTEISEKIFGAVISFYENYPEEKLSEDEKYKLGLLRGDGVPAKAAKTVHTNKAICLLSRWPMFNAFKDFLFFLYSMTVSPNAHDVPVERHIAHFLYKVPFPTSQRPRVQYQMSPFHLTLLTRPQITPIPISGASFLALLDDLGPENTMTLLVLALTEHKIVIHSLRPAEITRVAEALITVLFPFKWQCTYVPLCPLEMGYVMEAPCPFIVGVDSRYFDYFDPPSDVACVNLDTNSITIMDEKRQISWRLLPRKPAKLLRNTLQKYFKEVKEWPREESINLASVIDPDVNRTEKHRHLELDIQEAILKLMVVLMKGYRQYLLPITEAPNEGTTDPSSLFNIQEFVKSREKASHRFFNMLIGTQLFSSFIEERSLTSFVGGGELAAGRSSSLVFFDECIDRINPDYDNIRLIEGDETMKSEHTVMIMPPDETGLPPGVGYQYTTFPQLQDELFTLDDLPEELQPGSNHQSRKRRVSDTFTFGRRTKQEVRSMQRMSKRNNADAQLWARLLLSHTYGAWFACLPAFVLHCRHKAAALRTAHDALYALEAKGCLPLPDETYYRMLLHLCATYNKPALAVRVYQFVRKTGTQLSAITYGLYNKAMLEGTWPSSNRDGYMLWRKLSNVLLIVRHFRYNLRIAEARDFSDSDSHTSSESMEQNFEENDAPLDDNAPANRHIDRESAKHDEISYAGSQDHGYSSMPKDQVRRGSPVKNASSPGNALAKPGKVSTRARSNSGSTETTTDSVISSLEGNDTPKSTNLERTSSGRSVQPPSTLDLPTRLEASHLTAEGFPVERGMRSDDTIVNGDLTTDGNLDAGKSPARRARRAGSIVRSTEGYYDDVDLSQLPTPSNQEDNVFADKNKLSEATENNDLPSNEHEKSDCTPAESKSDLSVPSRCTDSPATPEIASMLKDDFKIFSSMSDAEQRRYQELCRRPSSIDSDSSESYRTTRHGSLLLSSTHRYRSNSTYLLSGGSGGLSPLVGQKSLAGGSNPNTPTVRNNFDNVTAEDLVVSRPVRSASSSILSSANRSPARFRSPSRRIARKITGSNILVGKDGVPVLTSTPVRLEPTAEEVSEKTEKDSDTNIKKKRNSKQLKLKQEAVRKDISHLSEDPLSPVCDPLSQHAAEAEQHSLSRAKLSNSLSRHLVEEIEGHLDSLVRSSSDATLINEQRQRLGKNKESDRNGPGEKKLQRKASLPSSSPKNPRKRKPPPLQRSLTCHEDITNQGSNGWFSSGSKLNNLLKATTVGMANKAKKAASNFAKDINETVQASLALYNTEKLKGSFSDLSLRSSQEDDVSKCSYDVVDGRRRNPEHIADHHSSQSSLRSADSIRSAQEQKHAASERVSRKSRRRKNPNQLDRPLSLPNYDFVKGRVPTSLGNSALSIPTASNDSVSDVNFTSSTNSLNSKALSDVEVVMTSCSRCYKCNSLVYDEEIMAGWLGDDSNLNTRCPFCSSLFVPFLNIDITDFRSDETQLSRDNTSTYGNPQTAAFEGSFNVAVSPNDSQTSQETDSLNRTLEGPDNMSTTLLSTQGTKSLRKQSAPLDKTNRALKTSASSTSSLAALVNSHQGQGDRAGPTLPRTLEPVTVPYLSSLVLRKELESLLENEGTDVLMEPHFVDHHPIIYWNLVWYFRRLNLRSNLYDLLPQSNLLRFDSNRSSGDQSQLSKCIVTFFLMWDNLKLQDFAEKPPMYYSWLQMNNPVDSEEEFAYAASFLDNIVESIKTDDVRGPLVAVLNELNVQRGGVKRSAYREILNLVVAALGKSMIDVRTCETVHQSCQTVFDFGAKSQIIRFRGGGTGAFDREYKRAYNALSSAELALARKCDRPLAPHAIHARVIFGELNLSMLK